jgi:hypothetical protein
MKRKLLLSFILLSVFTTNVLMIIGQNKNRPTSSVLQEQNKSNSSNKFQERYSGNAITSLK